MKTRRKVTVSPAGVHKLVKVDTFAVTMLVHVEDLEDEDNAVEAKLRDLQTDLPRAIVFATSDITVEHHCTRQVPDRQVLPSLRAAVATRKTSRPRKRCAT